MLPSHFIGEEKGENRVILLLVGEVILTVTELLDADSREKEEKRGETFRETKGEGEGGRTSLRRQSFHGIFKVVG